MIHQRSFFRRIETENAVRKDLDAAHLESQFRQVEGRGQRASAFPDRLHEAADVGVVARHGAFKKRRVDDRFPECARERVGGRPRHAHANDMAHALAVAHDVLSQIRANLL